MTVDLIHALAWDSSFFTQKVGRCMLADPQSLSGLIKQAEHQSYSLLYLESPHELQDQPVGSFSLLDVGGQIKFAKKLLATDKHMVTDDRICPCALQDICPDICDLAYLSGSLSRFRVDPALPQGSFERLYQAWLLKTLDCMPMGSVHAYRVEGQPVGLITCEWDESTCSIGLLAVHPLWQGQGIGTKLIRQAESLCNQNNIRCLEVKTQIVNLEARGLYLKNSFREVSRTHLYHAHLLAR